MPGGATSRFTTPEDYEASLDTLRAEMVMGVHGGFQARLTQALLPNLTLLCAQENLLRAAYLTLPEKYSCISVSMQSPSRIIGNGVELQPHELVFHRPHERTHQRTTGATCWSLLMLAKGAAAPLRPGARAAKAGSSLPVGRTIRALPQDHRRLIRLLGRMARSAEARPVSMIDPENAAMLERDVLDALVTCIDGGEIRPTSLTTQHYAEIMGRFEVVLARAIARPPLPSMPELCADAGLPERTLRTCCAAFLGVSPSQYLRLRRLKLVRAAILAADEDRALVGDIARRYGFTEMGRFAATYRSVFGEVPSVTRRHAGIRLGLA